MRIRAIPKKLLIHSAIHKYNPQDDGYGNKTYASVSLAYVRIEPSSAIVVGKDNIEHKLTSTLFFDCENSTPAGHSFDEQELIDFNGDTYTIVSIDKLYDNSRLHHWELGLE